MAARTFAVVLVAGLVSLAVASQARAADISGTWKASFDTDIGTQNYTYEFKVSGTELTVKAKSETGTSQVKNGKVDGDKVTFVETLRIQGMTIEVTYTGTVVSADEIKFSRKVGGFATEELVATRVK
jgi:hypothetical protein